MQELWLLVSVETLSQIPHGVAPLRHGASIGWATKILSNDFGFTIEMATIKNLFQNQ